MVLRAAKAMDVLGNREARVWVHAVKAMVPERTCQIIDQAIQIARRQPVSRSGPRSPTCTPASGTLRIADGPGRGPSPSSSAAPSCGGTPRRAPRTSGVGATAQRRPVYTRPGERRRAVPAAARAFLVDGESALASVGCASHRRRLMCLRRASLASQPAGDGPPALAQAGGRRLRAARSLRSWAANVRSTSASRSVALQPSEWDADGPWCVRCVHILMAEAQKWPECKLLIPDEDRDRVRPPGQAGGHDLERVVEGRPHISGWLQGSDPSRSRRKRMSRRFFQGCDVLEGPGTEPDWGEHLAVIGESRRRGASST